MTIKYQYVTCFFSKNRDLSKSDHVCGSESCHKQRRLLRTSEKELMLLIRLEKITKPSLKSLDSTNPQSDHTNKDHSKAEHVIVCEVAKVPRVTSKQLKAFLTLANVNEPTIRRTLNNHGVESQEESHCSPKRKLLAKDHVDKPDDYWRKV